MPRAAPTARFGLVAALAAASLGLAACGDQDEPARTAATGEDACEEVAPAEPKQVKLSPPKDEVKPGESITARVATNCGDFSFKLETKTQPKTAGSFVHMVGEGLYDGTAFHRVVEDFVIQGGDPAGDGSGGPGYTVTEPPPPDTAYTRGVVAMARTRLEPAGASGSQFFVVTQPDAGLPPDYAVLGNLTGDEEAVDRIEAQSNPETAESTGEPLVPIVIERITLERG